MRGKLAQIEPPALVIWGAEDNTVPLRDAAVVADEWPTADLRVIPKAGHWPQFEVPSITQRYVAAFLGLPVTTNRLDEATSPAEAIQQTAAFLAHSDVGNGLNLTQRARLAAQCRVRHYGPNSPIVDAQDMGSELYIVQEGVLDVWNSPAALGESGQPQRLAHLLPGQIAGELSMLDGGRRSADVRAGPEGAMVLALRRERLLALCNDDPALGQRVLWNIATALALRLRLTNMRQQVAELD